jgi:excinuclease ABC subunit B
VTIYPKSHYVTPQERIMPLSKPSRKSCRRLTFFHDNDKLIEEQRLRERVRFDIEMLQQLGYCNGIENYSRHLSGRQAGSRLPRCLITCRRMPFWWWTNPTSPFRS